MNQFYKSAIHLLLFHFLLLRSLWNQPPATTIMKLFLLASLLATVALETVNCQSATAPNNGAPTYVPQNNFPWKNKYPTPLSVPQIKPEWAKLVNNATMPQAPISVKGPDGSLVPPPPGSKDTYCHWSFYQCLKPTDIASCQKGNWAVVSRTMIYH
jgi:hypothetical protein